MVALTRDGRPAPMRRVGPAEAPLPAAGPTAPVFELVRSDPPPRPRKAGRRSHAERVRPLLEQLMAENNRECHRVVLFPGARRAAHTRARLAKAYPEFVWEARSLPEVNQSAIWVTWTGPARVLS